MDLTPVLHSTGVISVADHPRLRSTLSRLAAAGTLVNPLPGTYLPPPADDTSWLRAVCAWAGPDGVLHGETAASLWLPRARALPVRLAHPTRRGRPKVLVCRKRIPSEFVQVLGGVRFATPAYAAVELAADDDGRAICEALRMKLLRPGELPSALAAMAGSRGQATRRRVVEACLANPWSYGELRLQRILRAAGITGWRANITLTLSGRRFHPDIIFTHLRLIIEFDGRAVHEGPAFITDRERQNVLAAHGYLVIRFGWVHLDDPAYIERVVRQAMRSSGQPTSL